jgi:hypothetical protein
MDLLEASRGELGAAGAVIKSKGEAAVAGPRNRIWGGRRCELAEEGRGVLLEGVRMIAVTEDVHHIAHQPPGRSRESTRARAGDGSIQ